MPSELGISIPLPVPTPAAMSSPRLTPPGIRNPTRRTISNKSIGDSVTFIQYSTESTSQNVLKIRCIVKPGGGVPLHYHRHCTEQFKVLRGVLTAVNGREVLTLKAGKEALVPVMTDHLFRNDTKEECEFEGTVRDVRA
jgi:mannose-6-phosphate isomerase-like protein (cupin superfamily)